MAEGSSSLKMDDSLLDMLGGSVLKILDTHNILNNRDSLVATPVAKLLSWNIAPDTIVKLKASQTPFVTALEYFNQKEKFRQIKFKVESLDSLTEGGIDVGSVTELFGEAGSGKSQLCMQLAINCALNEEHGGLNASTVYLSTDKRFAHKRLCDMANSFKKRLSLPDLNLLDNIETEEIRSPGDLQSFIDILPQRLQSQPEIRLVVIDSIAGVFRYEQDYIERAEEMRVTVNKLERLADVHNFAIIMTNHVTSAPGSAEPESCLGIAFENLVVTKLRVRKTDELQASKENETSQLRILDVIFSPRLPCGSAGFLVCSSGIVGAFR